MKTKNISIKKTKKHINIKKQHTKQHKKTYKHKRVKLNGGANLPASELKLESSESASASSLVASASKSHKKEKKEKKNILILL